MVSLRALFKLQPSQVRKEEHNHQVKAIVQGKEERGTYTQYCGTSCKGGGSGGNALVYTVRTKLFTV